MKPRILVLRAAGTNCDVETAFAFERYGAQATAMHVNRLTEKPELLAEFDGLALPGGFSYGDDIAAGKVLAIELLARLRDPLLALVDRGGIVLGICNGFQTLVKTGLLPGISARIGVQDATLADNDSCRYEDRWVTMESVSPRRRGRGEPLRDDGPLRPLRSTASRSNDPREGPTSERAFPWESLPPWGRSGDFTRRDVVTGSRSGGPKPQGWLVPRETNDPCGSNARSHTHESRTADRHSCGGRVGRRCESRSRRPLATEWFSSDERAA
jgi:putative intracellular protease/amidase